MDNHYTIEIERKELKECITAIKCQFYHRLNALGPHEKGLAQDINIIITEI